MTFQLLLNLVRWEIRIKSDNARSIVHSLEVEMKKSILVVLFGLLISGCVQSRTQMLCDTGRCLRRWDVCSRNCDEWKYRDGSPYCAHYVKDRCLDCNTAHYTEKEAALKDASYQCNDKNYERQLKTRDSDNYYPDCKADPDELSDFEKEMRRKYPNGVWEKSKVRPHYGP